YRVGGGLKGKLSPTWRWDIQANFTYALAANYGLNNRNNANWSKALDAVIGPNGAPICRSTLTDPTNGCVPANIFGINAVSPAAVAYVTGTSYQRSHSRSFDINANLTGELGNTWAGPIKVALGGEWRRNTVNSVSDPISDINGWRQGTFASFKGEVSVSEVSGEASIPLARDSFMMKSLDLDLAARYVNYSTSGSTAVWKIGLNWALDDHIRLRSTYSKDFRAPTLFDLYSASSKGAGQNIIDTIGQGSNPNYNKGATADLISGGNPNLKPELAHTFTVGVVLQPAFAPRLSFSADYFSIKLQDALVQLGAQQVVDRCRDGDQAACAAVTRTAGVITQVNTTQFNAQSIQTNGIDFESSYRIPVGAGEVGIRGVATYTAHLKTVTGSVITDTAGQTSVPHWRGTGTLSYEQGPFDARAQVTYIGPGTFDNTFGPLDINRNAFPAYAYTSLSASYFVTKQFQLYAKVENLFDTDPPLLPGNTTGTARATNAQGYDLRGRFFGFGARLRL
ncbi:MAG TPA: TonB-dependent receptor, partial [Roseimicrobium sp.]|nr:TonB-dependent receptor [Roseimicrobium sp.]